MVMGLNLSSYQILVLNSLPVPKQQELLRKIKDIQRIENQNDARKHHLQFMQYTWAKSEEFLIGLHTRKICERIDKAIQDFRKGKSSYIRIAVHHRSGKSQIVSATLPAHFIAEFPEREVMQVSYDTELAKGFALDGRTLFGSDKFRELYPNVTLSKKRSAMGHWMIETLGRQTEGSVLAKGLHTG